MLTGQTTYTSDSPRSPTFLVYFNGLEVPTQSVTIKYGVWQIPEASIEMVPDPNLKRIGAEDRIQVQVFYLDDFLDPSDKQFRLMFDGEIVGWGYKNSARNRSIVFTAVAHIAIFTQLFTHYLTNVQSMVSNQVNQISRSAEGISVASTEFLFPFSFFTQGLIGNESIKRPFDVVYNIVKTMIQTFEGISEAVQAQKSVPAVNFFTRWARLVNFHNRFVACPSFDENEKKAIFPILDAFQQTSAIDTLVNNLLPQVQTSGSMWDMVQLVFNMVFMELCMLPTAPLVKVDLATSKILPTGEGEFSLSDQSDQEGALFCSQPINPQTPIRLANYFVKPQMLFSLPPSCNVLFPSQIENFSYEENYATQPTRIYFNDYVLPGILRTNDALQDTVLSALSTGYPPEADLFNKARLRGDSRSTGKNFLLFPEELFKGPVEDRRQMPRWFFLLKSKEQAEKAVKATVDVTSTSSDTNIASSAANTSNAPKVDVPDIYKLYAEYEYFRERFSRRQGAIQAVFNPYVVPGFPGVVFDKRSTAVDIFCYYTTVQHTLSQRGHSTMISFSHGRTMNEMFDLMNVQFNSGSAAFVCGPREPITEVRDATQTFTKAEAFYQKLFYKDVPLKNKTASFFYPQVVGYENKAGTGSVDLIFIEGQNENQINAANAAVPQLAQLTTEIAELQGQLTSLLTQQKELERVQANPALLQNVLPTIKFANQEFNLQVQTELSAITTLIDPIQKQLKEKQTQATQLQQQVDLVKGGKFVNSNIDGSRNIVPTPAASDMFDSYDAAMVYNWRPICTLDEYISFYNVCASTPIPAEGAQLSVGARWFERIRQLVPLTVDNAEIATKIDGVLVSSFTGTGAVQNVSVSQQNAPVVSGVPAGFPQVRADWDTALQTYRNNVYNAEVPEE